MNNLDLDDSLIDRSAISLVNPKKYGYLVKEGGKGLKKNKKKRWFILHGANLYYFIDEEAKRPQGVIRLVDCTSCQLFPEGGKYSFKILPILDREEETPVKLSHKKKKTLVKQNRIYIITASSVTDRDQWMSAVNDTIKEVKMKYSFGQARYERNCWLKVSSEVKLFDKTEMDYYCTIWGDHVQKVRMPTCWKSNRPIFDGEYEFDLAMSSTEVCVQLRDHAKKKKHNVVGQAIIQVDDLSDQKLHDSTYKIYPTYGDIHLKFHVKDKKIIIRVLSVQNLPFISDPYMYLHYGSFQDKFQLRSGSKEDLWLFRFDALEEPSVPLRLEISDPDLGNILSFIELNIGDVLKWNNYDTWIRLLPKDNTGEEKVIGEIRLTLHMQDIAILPDTEYEKFFKLLLADEMSIIKKLITVSSQKEKPIAESLVKVFEMKRCAVHYLKMITKDEIQATTNPAVIFRSNSVATKSLDMYMRLMGMSYLHRVMRPIVNLLVEESMEKQRPICEMDPTRLLDEKEEKRPKIIAKNTQNLIRYTNLIFTSICSSLSICPTNFRNIFQYISEITSKTFPDSPNSRYTVIAGFFFLRFFCTSLLMPESFGLTDQHPSLTLGRDLMLIAKCLQNLANLLLFGKKENFMININKYITDNLDNMRKFLDTLSQIPNGVVDELPVKNQINWGREVARVHFYLHNSLGDMQARFSRSDRDLEELRACLDYLDREVNLTLKNGSPNRPISKSIKNTYRNTKPAIGIQKSVPKLRPRIGSFSKSAEGNFSLTQSDNSSIIQVRRKSPQSTPSSPIYTKFPNFILEETYNYNNCPGCHLPLSGELLQIDDQKWHTHCFVCSHCGKELSRCAFFIKNGDRLCEECTHVKSTVKYQNYNK